METETHYIVNWSIDIYATSAEEAAQQALAIQQDPESTAIYFEVIEEESGEITVIDFMETKL